MPIGHHHRVGRLVPSIPHSIPEDKRPSILVDTRGRFLTIPKGRLVAFPAIRKGSEAKARIPKGRFVAFPAIRKGSEAKARIVGTVVTQTAVEAMARMVGTVAALTGYTYWLARSVQSLRW